MIKNEQNKTSVAKKAVGFVKKSVAKIVKAKAKATRKKRITK